MTKQEDKLYEFGPYRLIPAERLLLHDGEPVALTPKAFDTLVALVERAGHLAKKEELVAAIWPDSFVEESNLAQNVFALRRALGESKNGKPYIETVPKRGYRFLASVKVIEDRGDELLVRHRVRATSTPGSGQRMTTLSEHAHVVAPAEAETSAATTTVETLSAAPSTYSAEYLAGEVRRQKRRGVLLLALFILAVAAGGYSIYRLAGRRDSPALSFQRAEWARLTTSGKVTRAAISPDGKYVVHVIAGPGKQSLRVRQVATQSNVEIVAPASVEYQSLTFTPDGNYVFYVLQRTGLSQPELYRVPTLGGDSKSVPVKLDASAKDMPHRALVSFSPDGKRFVFSRFAANKEAALMIANADGSGEYKLVTHHAPEVCGWPSWSPDGQTIAYTLGNIDTNDMTIFVARVADGTFKPLASQRWVRVGRIAWLADGSGLFMLAPASSGPAHQIWHVSYPAGEARRVTNNLNNYIDLSLTADSSTLAAVQYGEQGNIWIAPAGEAAGVRQITFGAGLIEGAGGLSWAPDGRIVYSSLSSDGRDIWIIDGNGGNQKQLTANMRINNQVALAPDGRIFFLSDRTGVPHIWRMDLDGGNPRQITNGTGEQAPHCSPDGHWVVYMTVFGQPTIWRVPAEGGEPMQLFDKPARFPSVSPDSSLVACLYEDEKGTTRIAILPLAGGRQPIQTFEVGANVFSDLYWMPDGRTVTYIDTRKGVSNVVAQPLDGGAPKPLTDFKSEFIFQYDLSRDGKQLAISRGFETSDVVLITDFR